MTPIPKYGQPEQQPEPEPQAKEYPTPLAEHYANQPKKPRKRGWSPDDYLGMGIAISVIGGLVAGIVAVAAPDLGIVAIAIVSFVGGLILCIGIVAKGVQVGNRFR